MEVFYLANKSENIYFTILGDCTTESKEIDEKDEEIKKTAIYEIEKLNKKYPKEGVPRFNFLYRKRVWNKREGCYLGWERKRGLLTELNRFLIEQNENKKHVPNTFIINTMQEYIGKEDLDIKYIIIALAIVMFNIYISAIIPSTKASSTSIIQEILSPSKVL